MYDLKSFKLAEYFLSDYPDATHQQKAQLAQKIQDLCEEFCGEAYPPDHTVPP